MHGEQNDDLTDGETEALLELVDAAKTMIKLSDRMSDDPVVWRAMNGLRAALTQLTSENKRALATARERDPPTPKEIEAKFTTKAPSLFRRILRETSAVYHLPDEKERKE